MENDPIRRATLSLPNDTEIRIVRDFKARKANLFDAWCKPEWVERWYGCAEQAMTKCELDFRVGGAWRWALRDASGFEHVFSGNYRVIDRPNRLAFTERYEAIPGSDHDVELGFEEHDGLTRLTMRIIHRSQENRDGHLQSGMETGLEDSFARMEEVASAGAGQAA